MIIREAPMASDRPAFWNPAEQGTAPALAKLSAPAAARNRDAILAILREILPAQGLVLEVASGSGEHVVHFARSLPGLVFQPSDPSPQARASIAAWVVEADIANIRPPLALDASAAAWPDIAPDAVICINMVHIAPWSAAEGLFRHAGEGLAAGAPLYLYGPFKRPDRPLEPSNAAFDASLRERDPQWGLRDLSAISALAEASGFAAPEIAEMPANNLSLTLRKR
ncbi:DUF938 domain-containing protein [Bosea sp. (in: a-proteobacteria)]|uniref:DUF938 domain-containing protein n=1 Tax=Bosea sp. (in: a-proteobacteria) TaxID=1871050 RepID=UPI0025BF3F4E|nr:DUF938 domain-containing protein [Bosea sp. (in: a-proteobacteria)]